MNKDLSISKNILIDAKPERVWDVLTDPKKIKQYLMDTNVKTDWKVGSPIIYQGEYQGKSYKDGGTILEAKPGKVLKYTYWSSFSGMEDKPENYSIVTFTLQPEDGKTKLTLTQQGFPNEEACKHTEENWEGVLSKIKVIAEEKVAI